MRASAEMKLLWAGATQAATSLRECHYSFMDAAPRSGTIDGSSRKSARSACQSGADQHMRAKPENEWTPENVTARDLVHDSSITACIFCRGCNVITEINIWVVGKVLADTSIQQLRFRCRRCGVYPHEIQLGRRTSSEGEFIFTIPLKPRCWDEGHAEEQQKALERAHRRQEVLTQAALRGLAKDKRPVRPSVPYRCSDSWL